MKKTSQILELTPENKSPENSDSHSGELISPQNQDLLTRIGIYSINIGSRFLSETYKAKESIGNFYGALGFATLDVLARKNSKFKRLTKFGGYLFYVGSCGYDLISGLNDFDNIWYHLGNFVLDVSMAYQLGKDMGSLYKELEGEPKKTTIGISKDLEDIVSFFKEKFKKENSSSETDSNKKTDNFKSKLKDYLSSFGKGIGQGVSYGALAGYSFGYSAFENLKEKYSNYKTKQKEKKELKKIKNEKIKKQRAEQKIKNCWF